MYPRHFHIINIIINPSEGSDLEIVSFRFTRLSSSALGFRGEGDKLPRLALAFPSH